MQDTTICLSVPNFSGNEKKYVNEAIDAEWVSTAGAFISRFEEEMAKTLEVPQACARRGSICVSGTSAWARAILCWFPPLPSSLPSMQ